MSFTIVKGAACGPSTLDLLPGWNSADWFNKVGITREQLAYLVRDGFVAEKGGQIFTREQIYLPGRRNGRTYARNRIAEAFALVDRAATMPEPRVRLRPCALAVRSIFTTTPRESNV